MVKIKIISEKVESSQSNVFSTSIAPTPLDPIETVVQQENYFTIAALARGCAATQIQAVYRGVRCRQRKYERCFSTTSNIGTNQLNIEYHERVQNSVMIIQRFFLKAVLNRTGRNGTRSKYRPSAKGCDVSIQTELNNMDYTIKQIQGQSISCEPYDSKVMNQRKQIIKVAYDSCRSSVLKTIDLNGFEALNVLQAMSVLSYREYEILLKTLLSSSGSEVRSKRRQPSRYTIRLEGEINDFENDINSAWVALVRKAMDLTPASAVSLRKKGNRLQFNSSSHLARSHLQQLIHLDEDSLLILEQNQNILSYDLDTVEKYLTSLSLEHRIQLCPGKDCEWTLIDYLSASNQSEESSFERTKTQAALKVIHHIVEWEKASSFYFNQDNFELMSQIIEKDSTILKLQQEVVGLNKLVDNYACNHTTNVQDMGDKGSIVENVDNSMQRPSCAVNKNSTHSSINKQKQSSLRRTPSIELNPNFRRRGMNQKRSRHKEGQTLNRIEIKFGDLFEKEKATIPTKHEKDSSTTRQKKKVNWRPKVNNKKSPCLTERHDRDQREDLSLRQTIVNARDKRCLHQATKLAWTYETKTSQDTSSTKSSDVQFTLPRKIFEKKRNDGGIAMPEVGYNLNKSADERFNEILEKLRNAASNLEL